MDVNYHIVFGKDEYPELVKYALENGIQVKNVENVLIVFDILQSDSRWSWIKEYLDKRGYKAILDSPIYTKEELLAAEWLSVWCIWHNGYAQPETGDGYENGITYTREDWCDSCGIGEKQIGDFRIKKQPNWGRRYFFTMYGEFDQLFVSNRTREILESHNITGVQFREVRNRTGDNVLDDVWQMEMPYTLEEPVLVDSPGVVQAFICPKCGRQKHHFRRVGTLKYKREIFDGAPDVVKSKEICGYERGAYRNILIRQSFYRFLLEHKMDRSLTFEPIELV